MSKNLWRGWCCDIAVKDVACDDGILYACLFVSQVLQF